MSDSEFDNIARLLSSAVPEREAEIREFLKTYSIGFQQTSDREGFKLENVYGQIVYNDRTLRQIYLISFIAWRALKAYSGIIILLDSLHQPFDLEYIDTLPEQAEANLAINELAIKLEELRNSWGLEDTIWPAEIPRPPLDLNADVEDKAAADVALLALSFIFLHEICHVMLVQQKKSSGGWEEEMECDDFARKFLIGQVSQYERANNYKSGSAWSKRSIGIALANAIFSEITPQELWSGSGSHPPITERFLANYEDWPKDPYDHVWVYMSCILAGRIKREGKTVIIPFNSPRELCENLTHQLDRGA